MSEKRLDWIALGLATAECPRSIPKILARFASPLEIFHAPQEDLRGLGLNDEIIGCLSSGWFQERAEEEEARLDRLGGRVIVYDDESYPGLLKQIPDPPFVLFSFGRTDVLRGPAVGIVGARRPTPYGRAAAQSLARELAGRGLAVASGLAEGIDSRAHMGALESGRTIAVLGTGLDIVYPRLNRGLAKKIAGSGCLVTEFPLGARPLAHHFPQRNRLISGLCLALIVVEAAQNSGSLITARLALEQNREVLAVPGNITSELSRGTNGLIQAGAKAVTCWQDVVEELPEAVRARALEIGRPEPDRPAPRGGEESRVLGCLRPDGLVHIDEIAVRTDVPLPSLLAVLLDMELRGLVRQSPGKFYQRSL
ncbi:MAG: DNA-processing protein DprA [Candidatus Aminicenantales bacterium]